MALLGWIGALAIGALALYAVAGPPRLPPAVPRWDELLVTLRGSTVPLDALAYGLTMAAWLVWPWLVGSLGLRLLIGIAESLAQGAARVGRARQLSDRVTLPVVRRVADGAVVALILVNCVGRSAASAAAAPMAPAPSATVRAPSDPTASGPAATGPRDADEGAVEYVVRPGDTLWGISERFYGTGDEFPRLVAANAGRVMPDGRRFTRAGVIQPGWVLVIPPPRAAADPPAGSNVYVVRPGDTLRGIAARLLGSEARWPEPFARNRGIARLPAGRVLSEPDVIWPGLRLHLPAPDAPPDQPAPSPAAPPIGQPLAPATPPAAPAPPVAPTPASPPPAPPSPPGARPPEPTPVATRPAVGATPPSTRSAPSVAPTAAAQPTPPAAGDNPAPLTLGAAGVAAAALAGGAAWWLRRRVRRSLGEPPIPVGPSAGGGPDGDFVEPEPGRALAHRMQGGEAEPVARVAELARRFLGEQGLRSAAPLLAYQGRHAAALLRDVAGRGHARLLALARPFGSRLAGTGQAVVTGDRDVLWRISGLKAMALLPPPEGPPAARLRLVALGLASSREPLPVNWGQVGHVLVAGLPGEGVAVTLTSVLAALAAQGPPSLLRWWTIAGPHGLPAPLRDVPHQVEAVIDPGESARIESALASLDRELARRRRAGERAEAGAWRPTPDAPDLVLVLDELGTLADRPPPALLSQRGPTCGLRILAGPTRAGALPDEWLAPFRTRLVLQTVDDDESLRLLGRPDAADLGGGELLVRVDHRAPVRVRGFRIPAERLAALVGLMHGVAGREPVADTTAGESPEIPPAEGRESAGKPRVPATDGAERRHGHRPAQSEAAAEAAAEDDGPAASGTGAGPERGPGRSPGEGEARAAEEAPAERASVAPMPPAGGARLEVRCLGDFVVRSGEQQLTPSGEEGASYKAWELLAVLAAQPDGAAPRDRLLAAVWPDIEPERAANRMRVAMARLRVVLAQQVADLPAGLVRCERGGTCRLDPTLVGTDVQRFWALCQGAAKLPPASAQHALQEARALYRGDLLSGRGARFYEWVEERDDRGLSLRERYREAYYRATHRLARWHGEAGHPERAVPLYRQVLATEPTLEDIVRDLYRCYPQLGDLGALIREDRHLRQALRDAYYDPDDPEDDPGRYQPEPETLALFQAIRADLEVKAAGRPHRRGRKSGGKNAPRRR